MVGLTIFWSKNFRTKSCRQHNSQHKCSNLASIACKAVGGWHLQSGRGTKESYFHLFWAFLHSIIKTAVNAKFMANMETRPRTVLDHHTPKRQFFLKRQKFLSKGSSRYIYNIIYLETKWPVFCLEGGPCFEGLGPFRGHLGSRYGMNFQWGIIGYWSIQGARGWGSNLSIYLKIGGIRLPESYLK